MAITDIAFIAENNILIFNNFKLNITLPSHAT